MSKKLKKSGRIELFSNKLEYVTSKSYDSPLERTRIVEKWKRQYPNRGFFIQIKPDTNED